MQYFINSHAQPAAGSFLTWTVCSCIMLMLMHDGRYCDCCVIEGIYNNIISARVWPHGMHAVAEPCVMFEYRLIYYLNLVFQVHYPKSRQYLMFNFTATVTVVGTHYTYSPLQTATYRTSIVSCTRSTSWERERLRLLALIHIMQLMQTRVWFYKSKCFVFRKHASKIKSELTRIQGSQRWNKELLQFSWFQPFCCMGIQSMPNLILCWVNSNSKPCLRHLI